MKKYKRSPYAFLIASFFTLTTVACELNVGLLSDSNLSFVFVAAEKGAENLLQIVHDDLSFSAHCELTPTVMEGVDRFTLVKDKKEVKLMHTPAYAQNAYCLRTYPFSQDLVDIAHHISDTICYEISYKEGISCTKILYSKQQKGSDEYGQLKWHSEIWQCDYDGRRHEKLTDHDAYSITPIFMRGAKQTRLGQFLFVSYVLGQSKIFLHGQPMTSPFISLSGNQFLPACAPSGDKIAFISDISGRVDLFIQHIDPLTLKPTSKPVQVFSAKGAVQASPSFRPDGKKIAFVSDHEKTPRIYIIDTPGPKGARGSRYFCLSRKYRENTNPSWSPDGKKIAYSAKIEGVRQIVIYDFLKREEEQVTFSPIHKENPSWSPTSEHLVFNTIEGNTSELFTFHLKQKKLVQITSGPHKKHYPDWSPYRK